MKKNELAATIDLSRRQSELFPIFERQAKLYTMGDSSSLPIQTVQELLRSIYFCIETHLTLNSKTADGYPLAQLFEEGQRDVWCLGDEAKALYHMAKTTDPGFGNIAYCDTLDEIDNFFRLYDLRFFAHDIPCMIDYPLCNPVSESLEGIRYISEYLRRLIVENRFCGCFDQRDIVRLLGKYQPEYQDLILNLFEPILISALGLALLNRNTAALQMKAADGEQLYRLFRPWNDEQAKRQLRNAVNRLCIQFRLWDTEMRDYLLSAAGNLVPLLKCTSFDGYKSLFCAC